MYIPSFTLSENSDSYNFLGRSTARGSFLLWMHHFKDVTYSESFIPAGAPATET